MPLSNTTEKYGAVSKVFHWLTALLILALIPLGKYAVSLPYETQANLHEKAWFFSLHKTLGVTVFFVALLRILWAVVQPHPRLLNPDHKTEAFLAKLVHWMLYGALVIVPLSGWITHAAAVGYAPIWWPFGQTLPLVPKSVVVEQVFSGLHHLAVPVLALSIMLHVLGALKHHFIDRDATLRRMLPGNPTLGVIPEQSKSPTPFLIAVLVWGGVIGWSLTRDVPASTTGETNTVTEQTASSPEHKQAQQTDRWEIVEGEIAITVEQFGSEVTGHFSDWDAEIEFAPSKVLEKMGNVKTTIQTSSINLGSVSDQAKGPDFFDVQTFPSAVFRGDLFQVVDGHEAIGTLVIKDIEIPVKFPFHLSYQDGQAHVTGRVELDRRDFELGQNVTDEETLTFPVRVDISLVATPPKGVTLP